MDKYQRLQTIGSILARGGFDCLVCGRRIETLDDAALTKYDGSKPFRLFNLGLRHKACSKKVVKAVQMSDNKKLELLYEAMVASSFKLCVICKSTWIGSEPEELTLHKGDVAHRACTERQT